MATNQLDPECQISEEGHRCQGRGGKQITATNGVSCFENARRQASSESVPA